MRMHEKAMQARQTTLVKQGYPRVEPYDELAIFGGRTGLVLPKRTPSSTSAASSSSVLQMPSIPPVPKLVHRSSSDAATPTGITFPGIAQPQQMYFIEDEDYSASAGLPTNWEGLYREVPDVSYSYGPTASTYTNAVVGPANPPGEGVMLEDRWSSFMHQYAMIGQTQY